MAFSLKKASLTGWAFGLWSMFLHQRGELDKEAVTPVMSSELDSSSRPFAYEPPGAQKES